MPADKLKGEDAFLRLLIRRNHRNNSDCFIRNQPTFAAPHLDFNAGDNSQSDFHTERISVWQVAVQFWCKIHFELSLVFRREDFIFYFLFFF